MKPVFIDTSAFVALANKKDKNHGSARRFLRSLVRNRRPLITSTDVADEVVTLVRMRMGHRVAVEVGEAIFESQWCRLLEIDSALRERAWTLFKRFDDQTLSLTDCTSFAMMQSLAIEDAFTFDRKDFAAVGFVPLPRRQQT
jgi:predicted nucleic acid-binding protein